MEVVQPIPVERPWIWQHDILFTPETYSGSLDELKETRWIWKNNQITKEEITFVPGLYDIFERILVGAASKPDIKKVNVNINAVENSIEIWSYGPSLLLEKDVADGLKEGVYKVEQSDNLLGSILSELTIETAEANSHKRYKQVLARKKSKLTIECGSINNESWTMVSFKPNLKKMGLDRLNENFVSLMKKRVVDLAACVGKGVKVKLDGKRIRHDTFKDYAQLYTSFSVFYERVNEGFELCVAATDGKFDEQVCFVNNIHVIKAGPLVDWITSRINSHLVGVFDGVKTKRIKRLKSYLLFVNANIDDFAFDKEDFGLSDDENSIGSTCDLSQDLLAKLAKEFGENFVKTRPRPDIPSLTDANLAGTSYSEDCTLILCEGESAKAFAKKSGAHVLNRNFYGVYPVNGKVLNPKVASDDKLKKNSLINNLMRILGLKPEKTYKSTKKLRYGHVMLMTDMDHDGVHVKGLLINIFHKLWPKLLKVENFLQEFITPIYAVTMEKTQEKFFFYTIPDYEAWVENLGKEEKFTSRFYKGLGCLTSIDGKKIFAQLHHHVKEFYWADDGDGAALDLAFEPNMKEERRKWIREYTARTRDLTQKRISYSDFIHQDLLLYARFDCDRSIPLLMDGLKRAQRKVLFFVLEKAKMSETNEVFQVPVLTTSASARCAYLHGQTSLELTIIRMAQDYVGSNNINLLLPIGRYGESHKGTTDQAKPRYVSTQLSPLVRFLFHEADGSLLKYSSHGGELTEPEWLLPIIPFILVNGAIGVATGWKTDIPCYNPRVLIENIKRELDGKKLLPMIPWYKGFKGYIEKNEASSSTPGHKNKSGHKAKGVIRRNDTSLRILHLPLKMSQQRYQRFLDGKVGKRLIKSHDAFMDDGTFQVTMLPSMEDLSDDDLMVRFRLTTQLSTSSMFLFDSEGVLKKYNTPELILKEFVSLRLPYYPKRKEFMLAKLKNDVLILRNKARYVKLVNRGAIVMGEKNPGELHNELKALGFMEEPDVQSGNEYDYLMSIHQGLFTQQTVDGYKKERMGKKEEINKLKKATPQSLWLSDLDALDDALKLHGYPSPPLEIEIAEEAPKKKKARTKGDGDAEGAPKKKAQAKGDGDEEEAPKKKARAKGDGDDAEDAPKKKARAKGDGDDAEDAPKKKARAKRDRDDAEATPLPQRPNKRLKQ